MVKNMYAEVLIQHVSIGKICSLPFETLNSLKPGVGSRCRKQILTILTMQCHPIYIILLTQQTNLHTKKQLESLNRVKGGHRETVPCQAWRMTCASISPWGEEHPCGGTQGKELGRECGALALFRGFTVVVACTTIIYQITPSLVIFKCVDFVSLLAVIQVSVFFFQTRPDYKWQWCLVSKSCPTLL